MLRCFALTLRIRSVVDGRLCNYSEVNAWFSLHAGTWERPLFGTLVVVVVLLLYIICCTIVVVAAAACIVLTFGANWLHDSSPCCAESEERGQLGKGVGLCCALRTPSGIPWHVSLTQRDCLVLIEAYFYENLLYFLSIRQFNSSTGTVDNGHVHVCVQVYVCVRLPDCSLLLGLGCCCCHLTCCQLRFHANILSFLIKTQVLN